MSLRVLTVEPGVDFSVQDVHVGLVKGLKECGATVGNFSTSNRLAAFTRAKLSEQDDGVFRPLFPSYEATVHCINEMLMGQIFGLMPDLVVVTSGFFVTDVALQVARARGIKVCAVMTEQPYELSRELWLAERVDHVALNDPIHMDKFREVCDSVWYRPHAYDPDVHHANGRSDDLDAVWIGTAYKSRIAFLEGVDWPDEARIKFGGNWAALEDGPSGLRRFLMDQDHDESCVQNTDTADWYRRSAMTWNTYRKEAESDDLAVGWAMGPREVEAAACGIFLARESRPEGDELFPMFPIIDTPAELGDVLRWSIANPDLRRDACDKAIEAVADRTFARSAAELLTRCGF